MTMMKGSFGWKEYLSDEFIPDTYDSLGFLDESSPPIFFHFSMSERLTVLTDKYRLGASKIEEHREHMADRSLTHSFRPSIYCRPCPAVMNYEENPKSEAKLEELEANLKVSEGKTDWWLNASKAHRAVLAILLSPLVLAQS